MAAANNKTVTNTEGKTMINSIHNYVVTGSPFTDHAESSLAKALECIATDYKVTGSISKANKDLLKALQKAITYDALCESVEPAKVIIDNFNETYFASKDKPRLELGDNTFAYIDGKLYWTPVSLVYGTINSKAEDLIEDLVAITEGALRSRLQKLSSDAGVSEEVASEAINDFMGFVGTNDERNKNNGLAFLTLPASAHYKRCFGSTKNDEIVVCVVLKEWEEENEQDQTVEEVLVSNALEFTRDAVVEAFDTSRKNLAKRYMALNQIMQTVKLQSQKTPD